MITLLRRSNFLATTQNIIKLHNKDAHTLILLRHGETEWDQQCKFNGWFDVPLSEEGTKQACKAGHEIEKLDKKFDIAFTSVLCRACTTLDIVLEKSCQKNVEICKSWRLNGRHYGDLTGMDKRDAANKFGEDQLDQWRREWDCLPPPIACENQYFKCVTFDPRYKDEPTQMEFPLTESLKMVWERVQPIVRKNVAKHVKAADNPEDCKNILIVSHGDCICAIIKEIEGLTEKQFCDLYIPPGIPIALEVDSDLKSCKPFYFIGDKETIAKATADSHTAFAKIKATNPDGDKAQASECPEPPKKC